MAASLRRLIRITPWLWGQPWSNLFCEKDASAVHMPPPLTPPLTGGGWYFKIVQKSKNGGAENLLSSIYYRGMFFKLRKKTDGHSGYYRNSICPEDGIILYHSGTENLKQIYHSRDKKHPAGIKSIPGGRFSTDWTGAVDADSKYTGPGTRAFNGFYPSSQKIDFGGCLPVVQCSAELQSALQSSPLRELKKMVADLYH